MRYTYAYKTSDGARHEASMDAESREAVFCELRKQGIKAIKVVAADGGKANGEIIGVRKRMVALAVLIAVIATAALFFFAPYSSVDNLASQFEDSTRRQIVGDAAVIDKGILTGWKDVFADEGERFLASFAIPGVKAGQRNTTEQEIAAALARNVAIAENDGIEARQIKAMVEGMKDEARRFVAAGGSIVAYGRRLTERQDAEIALYERVKSEIDKAAQTMNADELISFWEQRNNQLRNLGIKLVPLPE